MKSTFLIVLSVICFLQINTFAQQGYNPGSKVKEFTLSGIDPEPFVLSSLKENYKGIVVVFVREACESEPNSLEQVQMLHTLIDPKGYKVIAINSNDDAKFTEDNVEAMRVNYTERNFSFTYLKDESQEVAKQFGVELMPYAYILQIVNGKFEVMCKGNLMEHEGATLDELREGFIATSIEQLLRGEGTEGVLKNLHGCPVNWKKK